MSNNCVGQTGRRLATRRVPSQVNGSERRSRSAARTAPRKAGEGEEPIWPRLQVRHLLSFEPATDLVRLCRP